MSIEEVAGIVITPDGLEHPFGISDLVIPANKNVSHEQYFSSEIVKQEWFQELGYDFKNDNLYSQIPDMTTYNLSFVLNGSSISNNKNDTYLYLIFVPDNLTPETKNYFSKNYDHLKEVISEHNAFFQADIFHDGQYMNSQPVSTIDEFYEKLEIAKTSSKIHF